MTPPSTLPAYSSIPPQAPAVTTLTGWGCNLRADCYYTQAEVPAELPRMLDRTGTIARGLGRSYGDPALNSGGQVLGLSKVDRYLSFDATTGTLVCEAGVSLAQIIHDFAPRGFFPMITPGTKYVTVGGCIANDVHGKAHHAQGCFSTCVDSMRVLLANGSVVTASRDENSDLFWASFGGMGLLGIIVTATIRLRKVETTYFRQQHATAESLEELMAVIEENDQKFPYTVTTIDATATGKRLGRGVMAMGDHALLSELPPELAKNPLRVSGNPRLDVPFTLPEFTLNPLTIRVLNAAIIKIQERGGAFGHYEKFFYPLDAIHHWNRGYGRRGFTQYQFVIPFDGGLANMRRILETIVSSGELPFLNVLKRFGKESGGLLSFPREGWTFAIDFPVRRGTVELTHKLDRMVLDMGGRIYLGKDSYTDAPTFRAMYPAVDEWLKVKDKYDPDHVFVSDLGRRVGLVAPKRGPEESGLY